MDRVGPVEAEEADTYRRYARLSFMVQEARDPTDDEVSEFADKIARGFRRAALEAVNPDAATSGWCALWPLQMTRPREVRAKP